MRVAGAPRPQWKAGPAEDEPDAAGRHAGLRKKAAGVRTWLALDSTGNEELVEAGKHAIMRRTGLPARDLRILDPLLSYPSTLLGRERAIVINLEHIKAIITAHEVLLLNSRDPSIAPFVQELQRRFHGRHGTTGDNDSHNNKGRIGNDDADWTNVYGEERRSRNGSLPLINSAVVSGTAEAGDRGKVAVKPSFANSTGSRVLPFEFIALEACLEAACRCLEIETRTLEQEAHPALDKLTSKISTLNLERVRQIKSRLVAITGRVQKVRDELEHLLDDDDDMAEMYLTDKLIHQPLPDGSSCCSSFDESGNGMDGQRIPLEILLETNDADNKSEDHQRIENQYHLLAGQNMLNEYNGMALTASTHSSSKPVDVEELEMLLEAYFVQVDGTLNKLSTLREYVDDTEDYINIMLDDKQNHLLQMGVVLTTATLVVSAFVVLVGIFGMNIQIDLYDATKYGTPEFLWTVGGGSIGSLFLYVIAIAWCKNRRLLE